MTGDVLIGLGVGLAVSWLILLAAVIVVSRGKSRLRDVSLLLPRTIRLLGGLARDRTLPWSVRWRVIAAVIYAGQPFNLIPDWIPVIGYADNIAVVCWAIRSTIRKAGPQAIAQHWHGTPEALDQLYAALRVGTDAVASADRISCQVENDPPAGQARQRDGGSRREARYGA